MGFPVRGAKQILVALLGKRPGWTLLGAARWFRSPRVSAAGSAHTRHLPTTPSRCFSPCPVAGSGSSRAQRGSSDERNVGFRKLYQSRKSRCFKSLLKALSTTVASMVPFSSAQAEHRLIAGGDDLNIVATRIKTEVFQSEHRCHPDGAADHLHADAFAAQIFGTFDVGSDDQIKGDTAGERADHAQVQTTGRRAERRGAAAVGEMNLSARHTGDHNGRAGHVDLLNV